LQYAINVLGVKHILVCGHYGCGGVHEAMQPLAGGELDNWLRNIKDIYRKNFDELEAIENEFQRYDRLVELNVLEQCENIIKTSYLQRSYLENKKPLVHACVWDMRTGLLKDLEFNFVSKLREIQKVFDITG